MIIPPLSETEDARLHAIEKYKLTGLGREKPFDHVTKLAARLFDVPIALVSIVGSEMQCFRGACGIDSSGTPRDVAFCGFAILQDDVLVIEDALEDERFHDNPLVTGPPNVRFYAGAPLRVDGGHALGTLCLIDHEPRQFGAEQQSLLAQLAKTVVDIIELRVGSLAAEEAHRALAEERELLQLTVQNVSEGVALVDHDLGLILWNDTFLTMFGYEPGAAHEGLDARSLMKVTASRGELGPGDPDQIVAGFVHSIQTTPAQQIDIRRNDGSVLHVHRKSLAGGRFIMTARDVTEERQATRLKDELVSTVSHELRTPLTAIAGSLALMNGGAAGELPPKAKNLVQIAHKNSERLKNIVNDLLHVDRLQSGKAEFHMAELDLVALLTDAVEQNEPYADRFGVTLELELPASPLMAKVDPHRISQVMSNLISNAVKFSPEGESVKIALSQIDGHALISVIDHGVGIKPEFRPRLFERFSQEDASSERSQSGTGLGLAITKSIVEHHGGTIELDPSVAQGSTFHVRLPVAGSPRVQAA